jgi:hypothetical protein
MKWKEIPNNIPKVYFSAENWSYQEDNDIKLYITSSRIEDNKHIRIPTWMIFIDWFSNSTTLPDNCEDNPIRIPIHFAMNSHPNKFTDREDFCAFVVSNPICTFRNESFKALNDYKKVNSGGALFNNIGTQLSLKYPGGGCGDISKHHFFSKHKFTLSFENSQAPTLKLELSAMWHSGDNGKIQILKDNPELQQEVMQEMQKEIQATFRKVIHSILGEPNGLAEFKRK